MDFELARFDCIISFLQKQNKTRKNFFIVKSTNFFSFQYIDDIKISSVVCDERYDNAVVRVDKNGFHPAVYYIQKSQSVMWVWKGSEDEAHNIIHVKSPDSDVSTLEMVLDVRIPSVMKKRFIQTSPKKGY